MEGNQGVTVHQCPPSSTPVAVVVAVVACEPGRQETSQKVTTLPTPPRTWSLATENRGVDSSILSWATTDFAHLRRRDDRADSAAASPRHQANRIVARLVELSTSHLALAGWQREDGTRSRV